MTRPVELFKSSQPKRRSGHSAVGTSIEAAAFALFL